ncbi:MAG TPA: biotin--[acetyl-CoA-carboxylase] ligase [Candidatus Latescibacteria bacterium]|nr:biotin--[acetyl-CoA-carboxylase] ligase [Candidatus Latescibacterota bacterium]
MFGVPLYKYRTVTSTNDVALRLAREGAPEGTLVLADEQTEGRGRWGRSWHSPEGKGIWASLILRSEGGDLSSWTALAIARALREVAGVEAEVKFPNDVVVGGRKLAGVLVERSGGAYIVGFGVNLLQRKEDFPPELREVATSLYLETGKDWDAGDLLQEILERIEEVYRRLRGSSRGGHRELRSSLRGVP